MKTSIFKYNHQKFDFHKILQELLEEQNLSELAMESGNAAVKNPNSLYKNMEQSHYYKKLYDGLHSDKGKEFYRTYTDFINEVIRPQFEEPILYQEKPTHRILFKNAPGVSRFHRDSDYGHKEAEINFFLPQTKAFDTNTIWIESEVGAEDFSPMEVDIGEFARFKGVNLEHGAKNNTTGKTRISFDFRIIPLSQKPDEILDTTNWKTEGKENFLFHNAHNFVLSK